MLSCREAIDRANLPVDDDGQHFGRTRDRLDELEGWSGLDAIDDSIFQLLDMVVESVQDLQLLTDAALGFCGEFLQDCLQLGPPLGGEDVAVGIERERTWPGWSGCGS